MKNALWNESVQKMRERFTEPIYWFPFPALIAFGLVIVLRGHLFQGFNHRLGTEANVIEMEAAPLRSPGIWMSVTQSGDKILIVTDDHQSFTMPLTAPSLSSMRPLIRYLDERAREIAFKTTLDMEVDSERIRAVLAVDQKLKYIHIRPLLYALAEAKISHYGFETRMTDISSAKGEPSHGGEHHEEHL
jgi:hypothetical protein